MVIPMSIKPVPKFSPGLKAINEFESADCKRGSGLLVTIFPTLKPLL